MQKGSQKEFLLQNGLEFNKHHNTQFWIQIDFNLNSNAW